MNNIVMTETSDTDDTEKATHRIPTSLLNQFRHLAIDKNTTVTALIIEAMKEYISKGGGKIKK
jgi:hypothetical protein